MTLRKEERHKGIAIPVSFVDDKPRFLTMRDRRFKEWLFVTGGCRKREVFNPLRCALRELEEETRGVISLKKGRFSYFKFTTKDRSKEEKENDLRDGIEITLVYHVYIIEYNISRFVQANLINRFNYQKARTEMRKKNKLPIRRTYDENDFMCFDILEEFKKRKLWELIDNNVIKNPAFYVALTSSNREKFNIGK
jgi:8-oxo-dGTP pyrophosphatase MutT (NUDIX family)